MRGHANEARSIATRMRCWLSGMRASHFVLDLLGTFKLPLCVLGYS